MAEGYYKELDENAPMLDQLKARIIAAIRGGRAPVVWVVFNEGDGVCLNLSDTVKLPPQVVAAMMAKESRNLWKLGPHGPA